MDRVELRDKLLSKMEESIFQRESRENRLLGCLEGVRISRDLLSLEEYEKVILERTAELERIRQSGDSDKFWNYRCASAQIEHVYEVIKAADHITNRSSGETISASAAMQAAHLIDPNFKLKDFNF